MTTLSRRKFLKQTASLGVTGVLAGVATYQYGLHIEPERLTLERLTLPIKQLGSQFDGFKIVQLSDLHLQPFTQIELIERAVAMANSLQPDLVVLTGDYVFSTAEAIFELAPTLGKLQAPHGTVAIVGNHDLWTDVAVVEQGLREAHIPVLKNQQLTLTRASQQLYIAGLDDGWSGRPDLATALSDVPLEATVILLMHEPDFVDRFSADKRVALQLSGHSHGGQVRLPGIGALRLPTYGQKYDAGLYQINDCWLYTNRGLGVIAGVSLFGGMSSPPVRFNCPPEVTEITLISA